MNRLHRSVTLIVDSDPEITQFAPDGPSKLDSNGYMVVGGMDSKVKGLPMAYESLFVGCLTAFEVDGSNLELFSGRRGSSRFPLSLCDSSSSDDKQLDLFDSTQR